MLAGFISKHILDRSGSQDFFAHCDCSLPRWCDVRQSGDPGQLRWSGSVTWPPEAGVFRLRRKQQGHTTQDQPLGRDSRPRLLWGICKSGTYHRQKVRPHNSRIYAKLSQTLLWERLVKDAFREDTWYPTTEEPLVRLTYRFWISLEFEPLKIRCIYILATQSSKLI